MSESVVTKETEQTQETDNRITEDVTVDQSESGRVSEFKELHGTSTASKVPDDLEPHESDSESVNLGSDSRNIRRIIAEDPEYNLATVSELEQKSLNKIIDNFAFNANMYKELKPTHKRKLLDKIGLEIPLKVVTDIIEDGVYWKRRCLGRWTICDVSHYGNSWKRMFFERNLENIIENFIPEKTDRTCLEETISLSAPYIERLIITQLLPPVKTEPKVVIKSDEGSEAEDEIEEVVKIDHLAFDPIVSKLNHLTDLRISYDVKNCGMNFEWNIFQFTINDCLQLAKCVAAAKQLKVFHLTRSRVDCDRCRVLISHLLDHPSLIELDFSHNHIGDRGARALGKFINNRSYIEVLKLSNNMIKTAGAQAIAFAIKKNATLQVLDLRLNRILDEGGQAICKSLLSNTTLTTINLAGNEMSEPTAAILAEVVHTNNSLVSIDVSNNRLGSDGGKQIQEGMTNNRKLLNLDLRFTECGDEAIYTISQIIYFNQKLKMYENETDAEIKAVSPYIISDLRKAIINESVEIETSSSTDGLTNTVPDFVSRDLSTAFKRGFNEESEK